MKNFLRRMLLDISMASLLIIGALTSGLIGPLHVDLVAANCGGQEIVHIIALTWLIYSLVGVATGYAAFHVFSMKCLQQRWSIRDVDADRVARPAKATA